MLLRAVVNRLDIFFRQEEMVLGGNLIRTVSDKPDKILSRSDNVDRS